MIENARNGRKVERGTEEEEYERDGRGAATEEEAEAMDEETNSMTVEQEGEGMEEGGDHRDDKGSERNSVIRGIQMVDMDENRDTPGQSRMADGAPGGGGGDVMEDARTAGGAPGGGRVMERRVSGRGRQGREVGGVDRRVGNRNNR